MTLHLSLENTIPVGGIKWSTDLLGLGDWGHDPLPRWPCRGSGDTSLSLHLAWFGPNNRSKREPCTQLLITSILPHSCQSLGQNQKSTHKFLEATSFKRCKEHRHHPWSKWSHCQGKPCQLLLWEHEILLLFLTCAPSLVWETEATDLQGLESLSGDENAPLIKMSLHQKGKPQSKVQFHRLWTQGHFNTPHPSEIHTYDVFIFSSSAGKTLRRIFCLSKIEMLHCSFSFI